VTSLGAVIDSILAVPYDEAFARGSCRLLPDRLHCTGAKLCARRKTFAEIDLDVQVDHLPQSIHHLLAVRDTCAPGLPSDRRTGAARRVAPIDDAIRNESSNTFRMIEAFDRNGSIRACELSVPSESIACLSSWSTGFNATRTFENFDL